MDSPLLLELLDSGIPEPIAQRLIDSGHYRLVTADEAYEATGYRLSGWVVQFPVLGGVGPLRLNGPDSPPFVRLKPVPALVPRNGANPPKYITAKGAGCRPYFSPLLSPSVRDPTGSGDIDITEGEKKADAACAHGFDTIGLSGVDCWRDKRSGESAFLPELEAINWKQRTVRLVFDSDLPHKANVRSAIRKLAFELTRRGATVLIVTIPCEIPSGPGNPTPERWKNGLDDFIARHGAEAYRILRDLARPCVKKTTNDNGGFDLEWIWTVEPGKKYTRTKVLTAWAVFKDAFAVDPVLGALHWVGTHWEQLDGPEDKAFAEPFLNWCDAMGWSETGIGATSQQITCQLRTSRPWNPPHLLAFSNGTLDTASNTFAPTHRRTDFLTLCLPYPYDPNATCPRWLAFIHEALAGQQGSIAVIRAAIRWTLQPKDITQPFDIEACIDIGGRRGTGKGTTAEVILGLLGGIGHGAGCFSTASIQKPTALHQLIGKRAAVDTDASGHIADAGTFNRIVSNEPVEVKKLYVNETTARLGVVVWRFFNDAITVSGGGEEGMGRRIVTLTFNEQPARRDRDLKAALRRELPGIFAWVWDLDLDDAKGTLANAAVHEEIRTAAINAAFHRNPKLRFLYETFPDGAVGIASLDLYRHWCSWCEQEGHKPGTHASFSKEVVKVAGEPRRVGKAKVTTLDIPAMVNFDIAAHLGLLDATDAAHGRQVVTVDVIPPADQFSTDASNPHCRPPDVHPDAHLTSNQSPCYDSLSIYVDVTSLSQKEGIEEDAGEGRKTGQTPVERQECFVDAPAVHLAGSQPQNPPPCTAPWLLQDPGGAGGTARLLTVTEQVEAVLDAQCISPSHPQARNAAFQTLSGRGISRNQVTAAIDHLRQREAENDNPLLDFL